MLQRGLMSSAGGGSPEIAMNRKTWQGDIILGRCT